MEFFKNNSELFNDEEKNFILTLFEEDQGHVFANWKNIGTDDDRKREFVHQILKINKSIEGGLISYIKRAKNLLDESRKGLNPLDGYIPYVPNGRRLDFGCQDFCMLENLGMKEACFSAYVLVAGGLGERLGYSGIKVALPYDLIRGISFIQLYMETILTIQNNAKKFGIKSCCLPFVIMTSDDTHKRTLEFLESNEYFGMDKSQVYILKQEKVPCFSDSSAHLSLEKSNPYMLETKPHGHGDIHALLFEKGLPQKWKEDGLKWVCFFQDTNALVFNGLLPALGVSSEENWDMNSLAIPRKAKESIGAIARLKHKNGKEITVNVEYNQLDPLLRNTINPQGDTNDETGYSPFPGNVNQLIIKVDSYATQLQKTKGRIEEFVNPKYKNERKDEFEKSTRLECMMQDYPKTLEPDSKIGFTIINQVWSTYSPVKNSPSSAVQKVGEGCPPHSATSGELDIYESNCKRLMYLGCRIADPLPVIFNSLSLQLYPRIVWSPSFAITFQDLKEKISEPSKIDISSKSSLVINGADIQIKRLSLDGSLIINAKSGSQVLIEDLLIRNDGWQWLPLIEGKKYSEELEIRGFYINKNTSEEINASEKNKYVHINSQRNP